MTITTQTPEPDWLHADKLTIIPDAGHTPGPWTVGRDEQVASILALDGDRRFAVCVVWPNPTAESYAAGMAEKRANLRLIAAAPDMTAEIAALRELLLYTQRTAIRLAEERAELLAVCRRAAAWLDPLNDTRPVKISTDVLAACCAAIARASGGAA